MKKRGIRGVRETDMMSEADPWTGCYFEDGKGGPSQAVWVVSRCQKKQETDSFLETSGRYEALLLIL